MSDLHPINTVTEMASSDVAATGTGDLFLDGLRENGEANIVYALKCTIAHYEDGLITQREAERRLTWVAAWIVPLEAVPQRDISGERFTPATTQFSKAIDAMANDYQSGKATDDDIVGRIRDMFDEAYNQRESTK